MSSSPAPAPSHRPDADQLERRDRHRGRVINRSTALQKRREEFAANARPVSAGTSTIYDWTTSLHASPVQLKAFDGAIEDLHDAVSVGNHEVWGDPLPAHLQYRRSNKEPDAHTADAHTIAKRGVGGPGSPLPHGEVIQKAFGRHDVSDVKAHLGGHAEEASAALGAEAYATGTDIAFSGTPTLHTAAHEAAHIVQQRAGVSLKDGIGESGDRYERHADEVANAVVRGQSAEPILDRMAGAGQNGQQALQREDRAGPEETTDPTQTRGKAPPQAPSTSILSTITELRESLKVPSIERWLFDDALGLLIGTGSSSAQTQLTGDPGPSAFVPQATPRPQASNTPRSTPTPQKVETAPTASKPQATFSDRTAPVDLPEPKVDVSKSPPPKKPQATFSESFRKDLIDRTAPVDLPEPKVDVSKLPPPKEPAFPEKPPPRLDAATKSRIKAALRIADKALAVVGIIGGSVNVIDGEKDLKAATDTEGQVGAKLKILQGIAGVGAGIATLTGMVPVAVVGGVVAAGLQLRARGAEFAKEFDLQLNGKDSIGNGVDAGQAYMDACGEGVLCALNATAVGTAVTLYLAVAEILYGILGTIQDICGGIADLFKSIMSPPGSLAELLKEISPRSIGPQPPETPRTPPPRGRRDDLDNLDNRDGRSGHERRLPQTR